MHIEITLLDIEGQRLSGTRECEIATTLLDIEGTDRHLAIRT